MGRPHIDHSTGHLRAEIAARAARLIAEDHLHDFALAKRKAARQMGVSNAHALPSNQEIEQALAQHRAIYDPEHDHLLQELRRKAITLMQFFAAFRPYLTGSVLSGIAGAHSDINLILYHDDPKGIEFFLIDRKIDYEHKEDALAGFPTFSFWYDDTAVKLHLRPLSAERHGSHREARATQTEVERLLAGGMPLASHIGKS